MTLNDCKAPSYPIQLFLERAV